MKNIKENNLHVHPCGDCIYFGDEECMKHMEECNYSDKEILEKMKKEND